MHKYRDILDFCTGCGLCHSAYGVNLIKTAKGFVKPEHISERQSRYLKEICMCSGAFWQESDSCSVWGRTETEPFYAFSTNDQIRKGSSSGGILTEIALFLLKSGAVQGVIQTKASQKSPIQTETVVSVTEEDVRSCAGSRNTVSSPLLALADLIEKGKRYAFIGKPCDVQAVRNWQRNNIQAREQIPYLFSFFCAGLPSLQAEQKLLKHLNTSEGTCTKITYRGNGWPGYTVACSAQGETGQMRYEESWGKILGRDVALACRFCLDGIGEAADISCGDGWYIKNGKPDFSEHAGRNVVFVRTARGESIIKALKQKKLIECEYSNHIYDELGVIQAYQFNRRTTMQIRLAALKLYGRSTPKYNERMMKELGKNAPLKLKAKIFLGTLKRLHEKKF